MAPNTSGNNDLDKSLLFLPRVLPRDMLDIIILLFIAFPFQILPLFAVPVFVAYLVTDSSGAAFLFLVFLYVIFLLFSVWSVRLSPDGIRFRRLLGTPKFLPWNEFRSARIAARKETIVDGWLWPLFPAREMTACMSAKDHVRIQWDSGFCFFPPKDAQEFMATIEAYVNGNKT